MTDTSRRLDGLLVAVLALAGASTTGLWPISALLGVAGATGLVVWMVIRRVDAPVLGDDRSTSILLIVPVLAAVVAIALSPGSVAALVQNAVPAAVLAIVALVTVRYRGRIRMAVLTVGLLFVIVGSTFWVLEVTKDNVIDIVFAHEAAADALVRGENPYEVVRVENTNPFGDAPPIVGYPYPPVSLVAYGATTIVVPVRVVAGTFIALLVIVLAWSGYSIGRFNSSFALAAVVAGTPALGFMLYSAATEGFTSLLFLISGVFWRRRPIVSAVLLGLAIASKQYLVIPAFALLFADVERRWMRIGVGVVAAGVVTAPFLLWDPSSLIEILRVSGTGWVYRPDAISVGALGLSLPTALVGVVALIAMWDVRRKILGPGSFFFVAASGLAVMLALHPHSFANHWFGLLILLMTGIVTTWRSAYRSDLISAEETTT